jgi:cytochrome c-type biogenesis protein
MAALDISFAGAAGAGVLSFLSPCVLPLVPAYLCFISGASLEQLTRSNEANSEIMGRVLTAAVAFVLGFSTVFVALGATASAVSAFLLSYKHILGPIAGVIIGILGLHYMGVFRIAFLNYEARMHLDSRPIGLAGAYVAGLAFAFGWTPCIGPVLSTILTVAGSRDSLAYGTSLLAVYALGLGVPFLIAALAAKPFIEWMRRFRRHLRKVEIGIGGLLVLVGLAFVTSTFETMSYLLIEWFPVLGQIG